MFRLALGALVAVVSPLLAADAKQAIVELYKSGKIFDKGQYAKVRDAFAAYFEERHAEWLKKAWGEDHEALLAWLNAHPRIKGEFFNALREGDDNVPAALSLFRQIWKGFPGQVETYADLAIAVAVVWDNPRAVYNYAPHQVRTKSKMPEGEVDALGNFRYVVENEKIMEGRTKNLPWEFLTFVIDHKTPLKERAWAQAYYIANKGKGKWHQDVPYDYDMLDGEVKKSGKTPKLMGQDYTLANIRALGGVCAMQADFAARVGKSVGVPAVYCGGESAHRGRHAWWMYVRTEKTSTGQIKINLVSDGRFAGKDMFFTGDVLDPQSGKRMLDRDMERRLWVIGLDKEKKRHSDLLMRAYPWLARELEFDTRTKTAYLDKTLKLSNYAEEAWTELARMAKAGEFDGPKEKKIARDHLLALTTIFAAYPDFVWRIYDDFLTVCSDAKEQLKLYERAALAFEKAARPDLACDARLKIANTLVEHAKAQEAAKNLILAIRKFPTEGRYVPKMAKRLQEIAPHYKGGPVEVANLYLEIIPAMKVFYKGEEGVYYQSMLRQAIAFLEANALGTHERTLKAKVGAP